MPEEDGLQLLERFFASLDNPDFLDRQTPDSCRKIRTEAAEALADLLLSHRPFLEREAGLMWPYRELAKRRHCLEKTADGAESAGRDEARLFLALLPFPGQWRRLRQAEAEMADNPELRRFLREERARIAGKVDGKKQKKYKLRHFCQVLKRPRLPGEKGLLRIFSLPYIFADARILALLNRHYVLYVEPPWGVIFRHAWLRVFAGLEDPVVFGLGGHEDREFLAGQDGVVTTCLAHGDYLEDSGAGHEIRTKEFDLVFNATFDEMERKRHAFMLDSLASPPLAGTTALFIGRGERENIKAFSDQAALRGLGRRVEVVANLPRREVPDQLARARLGVLTSQNENGCRAVYEYFCADLPCIVTTSMAGFNFGIINSRNGIAVPDARLPEAIRAALANLGSFSPRSWFLSHSGSRNSTEKLNREMKELFSRLGYSWSEDIVPLSSSGANRYVSEEDFASFRDEFRQLFAVLQGVLPVPLTP